MLKKMQYFKSQTLYVLIIFLTMATLTITVNNVASAGTTYYIDAINGDDGNSGTSQTKPFETISRANQAVELGDSVIIMSGTYSGLSI